MKLLNQSIKYATLPMLLIVSVWAVIFYFSIYREIKKSVDEGLDHYKRQIVYQASIDTLVLSRKDFDKSFYSICPIDAETAFRYKDRYSDTIMLMQDADDPAPEPEPARLLTTAFELDGNYYELRVIHSMIEEDDLVKQLFINILWLLVLLFLTLALVNNYALQRLWKPFYKLLGGLKTYKLSDRREPPHISTDTTEFNDLQQAVSTLIQQNKAVYEQQKQFIGNASHELQTPLAITANKLELLAETGDLNDEQAQSIATLTESVNRLIRLNKSLLLLSKIENCQYMDVQDISINSLLSQELEMLEEIAGYRKISIEREENDELIMTIDPTLARIVISNLLRNALFHNHRNGRVNILIDNDTLTICNSGKPEALDSSKIFLRFHKSDDSSNNSGLGLAIVKAICDLNKLYIHYTFSEKMHCFRISYKEK